LQLVPPSIEPVKDTVGSSDHDCTGPMGYSRLLLSKPVIAAVSGYAVAGGLELACFCDMRVVEEDAQFGVFCRRWGVPLIDGGTWRLPRLIGLSNALDMILTGRAVSSYEAQKMGLANRVVPRGTSLENALVLAKQIATFPQACMKADRMSAYRQYECPTIRHAIAAEYNRGTEVLQESVQGAANFAIKKEGRHGDFGQFSHKKSKL